jgi:hypothetical protein
MKAGSRSTLTEIRFGLRPMHFLDLLGFFHPEVVPTSNLGFLPLGLFGFFFPIH